MINEEKRKEILEKERIKAKLIHEKAKKGVKTFKREFKREMNTAILAAFGFLIALVWKDVITEFVDKISQKSPFGGTLVSALIVTVICVFGIMFFSIILKNREEDEKSK